jgi:integrase
MQLNKKSSFIIEDTKLTEIEKKVKGYWEKDDWDLSDSFFSKLDSYKKSQNVVSFSDFNHSVKIEIKYYFSTKLAEREMSFSTFKQNLSFLKILNEFINKNYRSINSFIDIPLEKGIKKWKAFMLDKKQNIENKTIFFKNILTFYYDYYDERSEFEKDIWDFRKIPGAKFTKNESKYKLNFKKTPTKYKEVIKIYFKYKVSIKMSQSDLKRRLNSLIHFLHYIENENKQWINLNDLTRSEMEKYFAVLRSDKGDTLHVVRYSLLFVKDFLEYLEKTEHNCAPKKPISTLIFFEDIPGRIYDKDNIKHIPDVVIQQLEKILNTSPKDLKPLMLDNSRNLIPIIILLLNTGWRISDILNLRYNNCLVHNKGWYLQGDIPKVEVKSHRVPIEDDVAKIVQTVVEKVKTISTNDNNPEKYLFPTLSGKRKGLPLSSSNIAVNLNKWAKDYNITDDNGSIYHFKNHSFRHTKGVELVNAGMNLLHIQKWMAHASPEMTLIYARLTDDTLRKEWIKAKEESNFLKINISEGTVSEISDENLLEWEYIRNNIEAAKVPMGYCMASQKMSCPYVETPCLTCTNFCTTPNNLPEFEAEIINLENLIERTKDMPIWNEKNQKRHDKLVEIRNTLAKGNIHHPAGKKAREYIERGNING